MTEIDYPHNKDDGKFENVEIHQKFAEIGRFEFEIPRETADFLDFP